MSLLSTTLHKLLICFPLYSSVSSVVEVLTWIFAVLRVSAVHVGFPLVVALRNSASSAVKNSFSFSMLIRERIVELAEC